MTEYTPSAGDMRTAWDECGDSAVDLEEAEAEFDRFLARVKRDAAREALDGLAQHAERMSAQDRERRMLLSADREQHVTRRAVKYRDTHYPETEDQT